MTFEELKAIAKEQKATYTAELPFAWRKELLAMLDYVAECDEYNPDLAKLHDDMLNSKVDDLADFFKAFEEETNGKKYGVAFSFYAFTDKEYHGVRTDELTNNGDGFTWGEAYETSEQMKGNTDVIDAYIYEL